VLALIIRCYLGECVVPQHKLVVADFRFQVHVHRDKRAKITRTKWWKLRGEAGQTFKERMLAKGPWEEGEDADDMWLKWQHMSGRWLRKCLA
jgi:hypothetical protein